MPFLSPSSNKSPLKYSNDWHIYQFSDDKVFYFVAKHVRDL